MNILSILSRLCFIIMILSQMAGCGGSVSIQDATDYSSGAISPTQKPYTINGKTYYPITSADGYWERGTASWYGDKFHGRKTSNGETYNMYAKTAAHKTLPMNTMLLVRNLDNGRETVVRVNDRGPFVRDRIIDLSYKAASDIEMVNRGVARAEIIAMGESTKPKGGKPGTLRHPDFFKGQFFIQVGSFLNKNNAEKVAKLLMAARIKVRIQPYITSGHTYFRVQVFAGTSLKLAKILEKKLLVGYPGSFIFAR